MAGLWLTITPDTRDALEQHTRREGRRVTITDQLTRDAWAGVRAVLERLGGTYVPHASAFDLPAGTDAADAVQRALAAGKVMSAAGAEGYVPTPGDLADELVDAHALLPGHPGRPLRVLEPSAGTGRFVSVILQQPGVAVTAVEVDAARASQIPTGPDVTTVLGTFEEYAATRPAPFDRVIMNPPFSVPGHAQLWAEHLLLAWSLLAPGGRLVAILPASALDTRSRGLAKQTTTLIADHGGGIRLDRDAFAASGTMFATCVVWLDRLPEHAPTTAPPAGTPSYLPRAYTGAEIPVPVDRPYLTPAATRTMPVQVWPDPWTRTHATFVHRGDCAACGRPAWTFLGDVGNDPRGALGAANACWSLSAAESGAQPQYGPDIVLCADCGNDGDVVGRMLRDVAARHWTTEPPETPTPPPAQVPVPAARREPEQMSLLDLAGV